jgi:hypothetical protein
MENSKNVIGNNNTTATSPHKASEKPTTTSLKPTASPSLQQQQQQQYTDFTSVANTILHQSNIIVLLWVLAVYFVLFLLFGSGSMKDGVFFGSFFDMIVFALLLVYVIVYYVFFTADLREHVLVHLAKSYLRYLDDPISIFSIGTFIIALYSIIFFFSFSLSFEHHSIILWVIENVSWVTLALIVVIDAFKWLFGIDLVTWIMDYLFPKVAAVAAEAPVGDKKEVFNISNNLYTFDEAQAVCASYGADLATYDQINEYYNKGGGHCNYSWITDGWAVLPTQKETWDRLQKNEKTKNVCGHWGINAGKFDKDTRLGIACHGVKPKPNAREASCMDVMKNLPKTPNDIILDEKVKFFREHADDLLNITSFNSHNWSIFEKGLPVTPTPTNSIKPPNNV